MAAKVFEVGDVLPATTQLKISWVVIGSNIDASIETDFLFIQVMLYYNPDDIIHINWISVYEAGSWISPYTDQYGNHNYMVIDVSSWSELKRTISYTYYGNIDNYCNFYWEDLAPVYSITFEENGGSTVIDLTEQTNLPSPLPTTAKANHAFAGWYYDNLLTQKAIAGDELTTNVTLYAKWYTPTTWCEDIADAIREKEGSSEPIKHVDFPERILAIDSGIDVSDANAVVGDVLTGKTFYAVDDTKKTGTMADNGTVNTDITTKAQEVTIAGGKHSGSGKVKISTTEQAKIIADNIKSGVTILGQAGTVTPAKEEETKTVTPNFASGNVVVTPTTNYVMTQVTINKDTTNHIAENIKKDVTLYGVTGTLEGGGGATGWSGVTGYTISFTGHSSAWIEIAIVYNNGNRETKTVNGGSAAISNVYSVKTISVYNFLGLDTTPTYFFSSYEYQYLLSSTNQIGVVLKENLTINLVDYD